MVIFQNTVCINNQPKKKELIMSIKRPKLYLLNKHNTFMVVVQCPHCVEDIELGDDSFGLFECPYCRGEFEYESEFESINEPVIDDLISEKNHNIPFNIGVGLFLFSVLIVIFGIISIYNAPEDFNNTKRTCEDPLWIDNWAEDRGCSTEGDYGTSSACGGIFMVIAGSCFGLASVVSITIGSNNSKKVVLVQK